MKNYNDEKIDVKANVILLAFVCLMIYALYIVFNQYKNGDFGIDILLIIGGLILLLMISFSYVCLSNIINASINQRNVKEITTKGVKVSGEIIEIIDSYSYEYKNTFFKRAHYMIKDKIYYYAIVKYRHGGKDKFIKTPSLNFLPDYLSSNDVDVFIYNDRCYVDNFKIKDGEI